MYIFKLSRKTECNFSQCSTVTARITRRGNDDLLSFANNSIKLVALVIRIVLFPNYLDLSTKCNILF